jgi:hypothetical protein
MPFLREAGGLRKGVPNAGPTQPYVSNKNISKGSAKGRLLKALALPSPLETTLQFIAPLSRFCSIHS